MLEKHKQNFLKTLDPSAQGHCLSDERAEALSKQVGCVFFSPPQHWESSIESESVSLNVQGSVTNLLTMAQCSVMCDRLLMQHNRAHPI